MPCTANGRSRAITTTPITPPKRPSTAPAMSEFWTSGEELAVVAEIDDVVPGHLPDQPGHRSPC